MKYYLIENHNIPWGDYGAILVQGMTCYEERKNSKLQIYRTGPYVPSIIKSGIGDYIVTDSLKKKIETLNIAGLSFNSIDKKHIVRLDWEKWDLSLDTPPVLPSDSEPENYLLDGKHDLDLAQDIGELWELCVENIVDTKKVQTGPKPWEIGLSPIINKTTNCDIITNDSKTFIWISEKLKELLDIVNEKFIRFVLVIQD